MKVQTQNVHKKYSRAHQKVNEFTLSNQNITKIIMQQKANVLH